MAIDTKSFHQNGYLILPSALTPAELELLRRESDLFINTASEEYDLLTDLGCVLGRYILFVKRGIEI